MHKLCGSMTRSVSVLRGRFAVFSDRHVVENGSVVGLRKFWYRRERRRVQGRTSNAGESPVCVARERLSRPLHGNDAIAVGLTSVVHVCLSER